MKTCNNFRFHRAVYHLKITKFQIWINWSSVRNVRAVEVAFYKVPHNFGLFSIWTSSSIFEFFGQKCWTALDWTLDLCFWIMMPFWTDNYYLIINSYISVKQLMTKTFPTIQDVCKRQNILSPQNVVSPCYHYTRSLS